MFGQGTGHPDVRMIWSSHSQIGLNVATSTVPLQQVLLAAGDTFRAAAAEQLAGWADRAGAGLAAPSTSKQRPDALMYSAVDRVRCCSWVPRFGASSVPSFAMPDSSDFS